MSTIDSKIILHIDDDPDDRYLVGEAIKQIDPSLILREAQDGQKAIDFLNQAKLFGDLPCMIILDMNMPIMNGKQTFHAIRKDPALCTIPIVIFSTSPAGIEKDYFESENVRLFIKPSTFAGFASCIKEFLDYHFKGQWK